MGDQEERQLSAGAARYVSRQPVSVTVMLDPGTGDPPAMPCPPPIAHGRAASKCALPCRARGGWTSFDEAKQTDCPEHAQPRGEVYHLHTLPGTFQADLPSRTRCSLGKACLTAVMGPKSQVAGAAGRSSVLSGPPPHRLALSQCPSQLALPLPGLLPLP